MIFIDLMFAFLVAILVSLLFLPAHRSVAADREAGAGGLLFFFLVVLLAAWAGGLWIAPFGPMMWGVYWLPYLVIGLLVALLLVAASEPLRRRDQASPPPEGDVEAGAGAAATAAVFGLFFWILLIALIGAIILGYLMD